MCLVISSKEGGPSSPNTSCPLHPYVEKFQVLSSYKNEVATGHLNLIRRQSNFTEPCVNPRGTSQLILQPRLLHLPRHLLSLLLLLSVFPTGVAEADGASHVKQ